MIWTTRVISLFALAASITLSKAEELDVWAPKIEYPNEYTVWRAGARHHVTWDAEHGRPAEITNSQGTIYLVTGDHNIDINDGPLASGFDLRDGQVEITVPYVAEGQYKVVLLGDSGNLSQSFKIVYY